MSLDRERRINFTVELSNWDLEPLTLEKGQKVGIAEPITVVPAEEPVWSDAPLLL